MLRITRLLIFLFGSIGALASLAQTPNPLPVQGNLSSIIGSGQQYAGVSIQLQNCASPVSIAGYSVIVQQGYQVMANGSGLVNTTVWPNDLITCNGTTGNSQYQLSYTANGAVQGTPQCYQVVSTQGTWNLNAQQPIACAQSAPNPADAQYRNLNLTGFLSGVNASFSGNLTLGGLAAGEGNCVEVGANGLLTYTSSPCEDATTIVSQIVAGSNISIAPISGKGVVTIGAAIRGGTAGQGLCSNGVTYSVACDFITASNLHYQTVSVGGSSAPQEPIVDFIAGNSNITITKSDTPGVSTNITITASSQPVNPYTPTLTAGEPAGSGTFTPTAGNNDFAGQYYFDCSSCSGTPGRGTIFTLTFGGTYDTPVKCQLSSTLFLTGGGGLSTGSGYIVGPASTTGFVVSNQLTNAMQWPTTGYYTYQCQQ